MSTTASHRLAYPDAQRLDIVDDMHGQSVADPYRWLEDTDDPDTETWSQAQEALFVAARDGWPDRPALHAHLSTLHAVGDVNAPRWRGERQFLVRRTPEQDHPVLLVIEPDGTERVLIDPMAIDPSGTTTLDFWSPSAEGDRLVYGMSEGGTEDSRVRVLDVATGGIVEGPIDRSRFTSIAWLPGGKAYYYVRHLPAGATLGGSAAGDALTEDEARFFRRIYRHEIGTDPETDTMVFGDDAERATYFGLDISDDGRWLAITGSRGTDARNDLWLADLDTGGAPEFIALQVGIDASCWPWFGADGTCYVVTNRDAPRWRICAVEPGRPDFADWREVIAEDDTAVIESFTVLDTTGHVVVVRTRHAVSEVTVHDVHTGAELRRLALPGLGSVADLTARKHADSEVTGRYVWLTYTDFVTPEKVFRADATTGEVTVWAEPPGGVDIADVRTRQVTYESYDGTQIRMFLLEPAGGEVGPRPTILYGYGGFNVAIPPAYSPVMLAWLARGGAYAIASLRGGSEEGEQWHRAGMRENKQNVFDDFAAASDWLVDNGVTTRETLGIFGGSNGGLLVGAALTQHPEKYRAVVCSKPLLDMLRYELFGLGETWNGEYGSYADPVEFGWLRAYSPYHNVHDGVDYPAVLFTVFEGDTRVDTLHARKLCALLQHATGGDRPILIRRELNVGHASRSVSRAVELTTDQVAFLAAELGAPPA